MKEKCLNDLKSREEKSLTVNRTQVVHELTAAQNQIKKLKFELKSLEEQLKTESEVLKNERIELKNAENREEKCLNDLKSQEKIITQLTSDQTQIVHELNAAQEKCLEDLGSQEEVNNQQRVDLIDVLDKLIDYMSRVEEVEFENQLLCNGDLNHLLNQTEFELCGDKVAFTRQQDMSDP